MKEYAELTIKFDNIVNGSQVHKSIVSLFDMAKDGSPIEMLGLALLLRYVEEEFHSTGIEPHKGFEPKRIERSVSSYRLYFIATAQQST